MKWRLSGMLIAGLAAAWVPNARAQERQLSGTITRSDDGKPIENALVSIVGGRPTSVRTGANGRYSINVPTSPFQLMVRAIGFVRKQVPIEANQSTADVALAPDVFRLEE